MTPLRLARDIATGAPIDRDTRRACLAARRYAINSVPRRGILSGHWDAGTVVGAFRDGKAG